MLLLSLASLTYSATEDSKRIFLQRYYSGKYIEAHELVKKAYSDSATRKSWEERLHIHESFQDCSFESESSSRAMALLRIGSMQEARSNFGYDWESFLGRAKLAGWSNDIESGRHYVRKAMQMHPGQSELLFYAGLYAGSDEEAVKYFSEYLNTHPADTHKRNSARQTIDFVQKTKGLQLNQSKLDSPVETIDSNFENRRLTFRAKIDEKQNVVLLMDTGAAGLSLKDKKWKGRSTTDFMMIGLGTKQRTRAALTVFDEFASGKFRIKNPVAAVSPNLPASGIDGIAGSIIFSGYTIVLPSKKDSRMMLSTLDSNQLLGHLEKQGMLYSRKATLPFYQVGKMIILKGRIKRSDHEMDILLDTGAQTSILSSATARKYVYINYPKTLRKKSRIRLSGIGGKIDNLLHAENVDIEMGPLRKSFNRMVAANLSQVSEALELEVDCILGQDFLYGYTLLIDYKTNEVTFLS